MYEVNMSPESARHDDQDPGSALRSSSEARKLLASRRGRPLADWSLAELIAGPIDDCPCGHTHAAPVKAISLREGALDDIPSLIKKSGGSQVFLICDHNTYEAAAKQVLLQLDHAGIAHTHYCFPQAKVEPHEREVGQICLACPHDCDFVIAVGSGTLNDLGKLLSSSRRLPYMIVATAPSMDGYASGTSSMVMDGVKISLPSHTPDIIIADISIICRAPYRLFLSGYGDMMAKYVSICDWRVSSIVTGEYYCEAIAELIRRQVVRCRDAANLGLKSRSVEVCTALMEGLLFSGLAMSLASVSRPASGVEHYFSHIWDMRAAEFAYHSDSHGLQCLAGTVYALRAFAYSKNLQPDFDKAKFHAMHFDLMHWQHELRAFLGKSAEALIALESREKKFDPVGQHQRMNQIVAQWPQILAVMREELPEEKAFLAELKALGAPLSAKDLDITKPEVARTFKATMAIRDKYTVSRLLWDMGELEAAAATLFKHA